MATMDEATMMWMFDSLRVEPFGVLPLANLSNKGGASSLKNYQRLTSYNWLDDQTPTIIVPGVPRIQLSWNGGRLPPDTGYYMLYDVNHLKLPEAPMDPIFQTIRMEAQKAGKEFDFQEFDIVTDVINLQKLFAFCQGDQEGMFRIDLERVGRTVLAQRVEAADICPIDYESYDLMFRAQTTKPVHRYAEGPYQVMARYQFGQVNLLVRFEADSADFSKLADADLEKMLASADQHAAEHKENQGPPVEPRTPFEGSPLNHIDYGERRPYSLTLTTTYPHKGGFPFYTWAQLFFSGADNLVVGWMKGGDDFARPATYTLSDISKLMKPMPLAALAKLHDCLLKIVKFMRTNREGLKIGLMWKGKEFIEIYEKAPTTPSSISDTVKAYLKSQVPPGAELPIPLEEGLEGPE